MMLVLLAGAFLIFEFGPEAVGNALLILAMVMMIPSGFGWMLAGQSDIGLTIFGSRFGTFFFGGFLTYMFHGATTDSPWLDAIYIVALAPAVLHLLLVPPASTYVIVRKLASPPARSQPQ